MDLRDCRFYQGSYGLGFTVYSDQPCCARFRDQIVLPIDLQAVDLYEIEPGPAARWVVVCVSLGLTERTHRFFLRQGSRFPEVQKCQLTLSLLAEIGRKIPKAA